MRTSKVDAKKRIVLPFGKPGDVYEVQRQDEDRLLLVRLARPRRTTHLSKSASLEAMEKAPLRLRMTWEELRDLTREP